MAKKLVLVAIGGSGMRVAQSVVALAASGMLTDLCGDDYRLEIRMVDLDIVRGSDKDELEEMIRSLNAAMPFLSASVDDGATNRYWNAKRIDRFAEFSIGTDDRSTLDSLVKPKSDTEELLFHTLYDTRDRAMELRRGCKGNPRIGSFLWAKCFHDDWKDKDGFWRSIFSDVGGNDELRVMFAGSVFGGTGASGTPTLAKLYIDSCREEKSGDLKHFAEHVGLTLMLPYFNVDLNTEVDSSLFQINSKMAIKYYETSDVLKDIKHTQFVGDYGQQMQKKETDKNKKTSWNNVKTDIRRGANEGQDDPSMPAELMAAIGICRFFAADNTKDETVSVPLKWKTDKEVKIAANEYFPLNNWDYFGIWGKSEHKARVKDYALRLERFYLMLNVYYRSIAAQKLAWQYRPEAFRSVFGEKRNMKGTYEDSEHGLAAPIAFASSMFRWLEELDHHGMHELLNIEGSKQNDHTSIEQRILKQAISGTTSFSLHGIPGSKITNAMNSLKIGEQERTKYFVSSLMECCVARHTAEASKEGQR